MFNYEILDKLFYKKNIRDFIAMLEFVYFLKNVCDLEEKICKQRVRPWNLQTVLLTIPFNELPWSWQPLDRFPEDLFFPKALVNEDLNCNERHIFSLRGSCEQTHKSAYFKKSLDLGFGRRQKYSRKYNIGRLKAYYCCK